MIKFLKNLFGINHLESFGETTMKATIVPLPTGEFGLMDRQGFLVQQYSRARDARRGAARRGFVVA